MLDQNAIAKMEEKTESSTIYYKAIGGNGNGTTDNCTSYVIDVIPKGKNETIDANETVVTPEGKTIVSQNPTQLFKAVSKLKGALILKDIPKDVKDKSFAEAYYSQEQKPSEDSDHEKEKHKSFKLIIIIFLA